MKVVLTILFMVSGQWTVIDGWGSIEFPNWHSCVNAAVNTMEYLEVTGLPRGATLAKAVCKEYIYE